MNRLSALALALSLLAASRPSLAQLTPAAASRAVPIGELLDRNRDGRLDRDGDTVIVAGRASVASGALYRGFLSVWIEDATGGILLFQRGKPRPIAAGDSVIARGVLTPYLGMSEVEVLDYLVVPGPRRLPTTVPVAVNPVALTARSGQLGTVEGHLVGWGSDAGGVYAVLRGEDHVTHIAMFVSTPVVAQIELAQYGMGDHLRVTGIIVPFEPSDELPSTPHATYRVVPRGAADVELVGMSFVLRRAVALAMPLVLLAALATVLVLRREVRRKTRRLQESEQRFRSLFEYNPDAVAEYDLGGRLLAANPACERVSGRAERDLLGTRLADAGLPEERTRIERAFILAARGGAQRFEIPMRSAQGTVDQVDMSLMPIVVNGEVAGVYGIAKDVSARHRVQQELEANARLLSAIIDTQQAIARTELDVHTLMGRIIELVPRLTAGDTAGIGVVEGDALLMPHMVVNGEPLRLPLAGSLSGRAVVEGQTLRTGDALQDPRVHRGAQQKIGFRSLMAIPLSYGGTTIGVLTVSSLQPDAFTETDERTLQLLAGQLAAALSHAREFESRQELIAERTAALEALQASEERFRSITEHSTDIVSIVDGQGRYLWVSPTTERVLGHSVASLIGRNAFDQVHPEDAPALLAKLQEVAARPGNTGIMEYRFRHLDGSWRVLETVGCNMLDHPAVRGIVVNSRDMTEQRRLEDQLRHAQKMEAVGRLAGGVAHDFNNILTIIRVHASFLLEAMADRDPRRVDAEEIQRASDRAAMLTKQLLAFSRRQILQTRVIDLNESVSGIEPMLRRLIGEDISFHTQLDPAVGPVSADVGQLEQVLMNLAVNARDAMPTGGTITVTTADVVVRDAPATGLSLSPGRYAMLSVNDTGVGMDEPTRGRAFEPFFTTKEQGKGTGLGLATVYGVVQQSGGTITVESEPGRGSTFRVYLPCAQPAAEAETPSPRTEGTGRGTETILVVEDEDAVRSLARRILGSRGYRIIEARNGRDALERVRATPGTIDLVLTDVVMPEMGGRELAEVLTVERPETRVLFMSGYTDDDILRRGLNAPGSAFLHKPFTVHELTDGVRKVLDAVVEVG